MRQSKIRSVFRFRTIFWCLAGAFILMCAAPLTFSSCEREHPRIVIPLESDFSEVISAINNVNSTLTEKLATIQSAIDGGNLEEKQVLELIQQTLETMNGTLEEKLGEIKDAIGSQTTSLEMKLKLIYEALNTGLTDANTTLGLIKDAILGLKDSVSGDEGLIKKIDEIVKSLGDIDTTLSDDVAKALQDILGAIPTVPDYSDILEAILEAIKEVVKEAIEEAIENASLNTSKMFSTACECIPWTVLGNDANGDQPWMQYWSGYLSESNDNSYGKLTTPTSYSLTGSLYKKAIMNLDKIIRLNSDPDQMSLPEVTALGTTSNQIAAAKTLEAYFYMFLTDMTGPIVITNAFKGLLDEEEVPAYSPQNTVYKVLDDVLKNAYAQFNTSGTLHKNADAVFGGDISKWKKLNASIRMLLAIKMSDVDPANGKTRFARAYSDGGMTSASDGMDYIYGNPEKNLLYCWCSDDYLSYRNEVPNMILVEKMKELKDPRMFKYFDIEGYKGFRHEYQFPRDEYTSFYGAPFGLATKENVAAFGDVVCSINSKLLARNATIPVIPAARVLFVEAEAAQRGWISADAKMLYESGIQASFSWWGAQNVSSYISSPSISYEGGSAGMEQIAIQRWIASYLSNGVEAWSDWRRLNVLKMPVGPAATSLGITQYPYRMRFYTDSSVPYTSPSTAEAIKDIRGEQDDVTNRLWWDVYDNTESVLTSEQCTPPSLPPIPD